MSVHYHVRFRPSERIRIGDYGVVYEIHDDELIVRVIRVAHRSTAYRNS